MSVSDVAMLVSIRSQAPSLAGSEPSAHLVRWMLRLLSVIIFLAATVIGVQLATAAPTEPPVSISGSSR
jgi:soluble lytic murein transglycosylase-like protein